MSLQLVPKQPTIMVTLGVIDEKAGDLPAAVRQYARAVTLQPSDVGFLLLARALRNEGHDDESQAMFQRAVKLSPNLTQAAKQADSLLTGDSGSISLTVDR